MTFLRWWYAIGGACAIGMILIWGLDLASNRYLLLGSIALWFNLVFFIAEPPKSKK